jgi:hypothetical protein
MAKELPYFKFEPAQWENGNIQVCSFEAQGIFIHVCSMYWQRLGNLPYKLAVQKICKGNATAFDSLIEEDVIKVIDGHICIDFLNEQLAEFENTSKVNSDNARQGWEKRRNNATALQTQSDPNAIRGEEIREEKRKGDKNKKEIAIALPFLDEVLVSWNEWVQFRKELGKKITPSTLKKQIQFLGGRAGPEIIAIINQSIEKGWTGLFELKNKTNGIRNGNKEQVRRADATIEAGRDFGQL